MGQIALPAFFCTLALDSIKIRGHNHSGFLAMSKKTLPLIQTFFIIYLLPAFLNISPPCLWAMEKVSFKTYPQTGITVPNPMKIAKLPRGKTYQVNHKAFSLQFFFNEKDIFGIILKRNKRRPIHFRWCLFRSCEESQYDYKKVIAEAFNPPFDDSFFSLPYPSYLPYGFQGIEFSSPD